MTNTPQSTRRGLSLWHYLVCFVIVAGGASVIGEALDMERAHTLAGIVLVLVAGGLGVVARMRRLRASPSSEDNRDLGR